MPLAVNQLMMGVRYTYQVFLSKQSLTRRVNYGRKKIHWLFQRDKNSCPRGKQYTQKRPEGSGKKFFGYFIIFSEKYIDPRLLKNGLIFLFLSNLINLDVWEKETVGTLHSLNLVFSSVQSLSCVRPFATPQTAARQISLSINSWSLLKLMSKLFKVKT